MYRLGNPNHQLVELKGAGVGRNTGCWDNFLDQNIAFIKRGLEVLFNDWSCCVGGWSIRDVDHLNVGIEIRIFAVEVITSLDLLTILYKACTIFLHIRENFLFNVQSFRKIILYLYPWCRHNIDTESVLFLHTNKKKLCWHVYYDSSNEFSLTFIPKMRWGNPGLRWSRIPRILYEPCRSTTNQGAEESVLWLAKILLELPSTAFALSYSL